MKILIHIDDFTYLYTCMASDALDNLPEAMVDAMSELDLNALDTAMEEWALQFYAPYETFPSVYTNPRLSA